MGAGQHPDTVDCGASIQLGHEVKAVDILVKIVAVPVGNAILVPGHGGTNPRILDEQGLIERGKIGAVNGLGHFQQLRVRVGPEASLGKLQGTQQDEGRRRRRVGFSFWLEHFHLVPTVGQRRAPQGISQGLGPNKRHGLAICPQCRLALGVDSAVRTGGKAPAHRRQIRLEIRQFPLLQDAGKHIETVAGVGRSNGRIQSTVLGKYDGSPVIQLQCCLFAVS